MAITQYSELQTAVDNWLQRTDLTARRNEFIAMAEDRLAQKLRVRAMEAMHDLHIEAATTDATVGGTGDAITLTNDTAITAYTLGLRYYFEAGASNTGAVTLNVDGVGAQTVVDGLGAALAANDIIDGQTVRVYYDGTNFRLSPRGGILLPTRYVATRRLFLDRDPTAKLEYMTPANFYSLRGSAQAGQPRSYTIEGEFLVLGPDPDGTQQGRHLYYRRFAALSGATDTNWIIDNARGLLLYGALVEAAPFLGDDPRTLTWAAMFDQLLEDVHDADARDRFPSDGLVGRSDVSYKGV